MVARSTAQTALRSIPGSSRHDEMAAPGRISDRLVLHARVGCRDCGSGHTAVPVGRSPSAGVFAENLVGLTVVVPVVVGAAWFDSLPRAATPGTHVLGLRVEHAGAPTFLRAFLRSAVKNRSAVADQARRRIRRGRYIDG